MRIGKTVDSAMQNDTLPDLFGVSIFLLPLHKIADQVTHRNLRVLKGEIRMCEIIHSYNLGDFKLLLTPFVPIGLHAGVARDTFVA
jgi:hypothetical protein